VPQFVKAAVIDVLETRKGLQKLVVSRFDGGPGDRAYALTDVIGEVSIGDAVILNTTAVKLGLGTGGWHVVHWNLLRDRFDTDSPGHVMKARYLSEQIDAGSGEEHLAPSTRLDGLPVVACFLLSQAAVAILAYKRECPHGKVGVLVTDQAALPVAFSDLLHVWRSAGIVDLVVSAGQAFGGDVEAVNVASGLGLAHAHGCDVVFVTEGPGVVGTGSTFGFSAFEMAGVVDLVHKLGGEPHLAVRFSDADERKRHQGVSHHTHTVLQHCVDAVVAVPNDEPSVDVRDHRSVHVDVGDVETLVRNAGAQITTMGRSYKDDERFFRYAAAAGVAAAHAQK
jgi:hypothetical protein